MQTAEERKSRNERGVRRRKSRARPSERRQTGTTPPPSGGTAKNTPSRFPGPDRCRVAFSERLHLRVGVKLQCCQRGTPDSVPAESGVFKQANPGFLPSSQNVAGLGCGSSVLPGVMRSDVMVFFFGRIQLKSYATALTNSPLTR